MGIGRVHPNFGRGDTIARRSASNSVEPGYVATKLTGYHGSKPESVTDVFVFLASEESKGVTGKMLSSSGWKSQLR